MKLELTNDRGYHQIDILVRTGELKQFKIPVELRVHEVERLLEAQHKLQTLHDQSLKGDGTDQLRMYWGYIYSQLEVIFKHYHPEIDISYLKDNIMQTDAVKILSFFAENRYIEKEEQDTSKKKLD